MGILNITPDSFSDGGDFVSVDRAVARAGVMIDEGAAIIDVGGESTRPDAEAVGVEEELARVMPVIERLVAEFGTPVSIDTSKPAVMRAAARAGAGMINDVMALRAPGALEAAAATGLPVCLMHMQGEPRTMQNDPHYQDVVREVREFLAARIETCVAAGIPREKLLVDPGFGFGKALEHNLALLRELAEFKVLGCPILVGISRKSMLGGILDRTVDRRLYGGLAAATIAIMHGAAIIRTHDVAPTVDALKVCSAVFDA
jgi:dihydropteroate synthase